VGGDIRAGHPGALGKLVQDFEGHEAVGENAIQRQVERRGQHAGASALDKAPSPSQTGSFCCWTEAQAISDAKAARSVCATRSAGGAAGRPRSPAIFVTMITGRGARHGPNVWAVMDRGRDRSDSEPRRCSSLTFGRSIHSSPVSS